MEDPALMESRLSRVFLIAQSIVEAPLAYAVVWTDMFPAASVFCSQNTLFQGSVFVHLR